MHRGAALAGAGWAPAPVPPAQQVVGTADPLLLLDTHMPKLQAVRWNPADENVVGAVSAATRQLLLYDLQHTQVGYAATRLLHTPPTRDRICLCACHDPGFHVALDKEHWSRACMDLQHKVGDRAHQQ